MALKLGDRELSSNLLTSPLCGISNRPFRRLARRFGSAVTYVEMLKARSVIEGAPKTLELLKFYDDEDVLGAQFAGNEPGELEEACKIAEGMGFQTIDFNCGCPAGRVGSGLCGARMLSRPDVLRDCLRAMVNSVKIPVTVKIRAGVDDECLNYHEIGAIAEGEGAAWITLHPRTRAQGYKGDADHTRTAELKEIVNIPVIASGDVTEPEHAMKLTEQYGIDGVMIGRGIYGRPWLYRRIIAAQKGETELESPPPREILAVLRWHFEGLMEVFEPRLACVLQRRYSGWYIKGIHGAAQFRASFVQVKTPEEFYANWEQVDQVFAQYEEEGRIEKADPARLAWSEASVALA